MLSKKTILGLVGLGSLLLLTSSIAVAQMPSVEMPLSESEENRQQL